MPDSFSDFEQADDREDYRDDDFDFSEADLERDFDPYAGCYIYEDDRDDFYDGEW